MLRRYNNGVVSTQPTISNVYMANFPSVEVYVSIKCERYLYKEGGLHGSAWR